MKTNELVIESLMNSPVVKENNLSVQDIENLVKDYQSSIFSVLLSNGYVKISEDIILRVIKLKDRVYVLRGNSYNNHRKYKVKMVVSSSVYKDIEEAYSLLIEE